MGGVAFAMAGRAPEGTAGETRSEGAGVGLGCSGGVCDALKVVNAGWGMLLATGTTVKSGDESGRW